jgi:phosphoglycerate dehydrogenase-like enzyme
MTRPLHVVTQVGLRSLWPLIDARVAALGPLRVTHLDLGQPVPLGLEADALLTVAAGNPGLTEALRVLRDCGWVHIFGTGVDGFPFDRLDGRLLTCSRGATAVPIAEWVMAMMLAAVKRLPESWITEPPEQWHTAPLTSLQGATLGLVGLGHIAQAVARLAAAFGMRMTAVARRPRSEAPAGIVLVRDLMGLVAETDHLVVAASATPATYHLINAQVLAAAKPGLHLINVARGSLVDQDALRQALANGQVSRASLDVVEPEPLPAGHWLYGHPAVRLSPHLSWNSPDMLERLLENFIENLDRRLRGEPLINLVDPMAGY